MRIEDLLSKLDAVRKTGNGWQARCPAHEDQHASLSVGNGDAGGIVLHCHAECKTEAVVSALGLTMVDLMPGDNGQDKPKSEIVATYDYRDESGTLLFQAVRREPKGFFQRQPKPGGGWQNNLKGVQRVPYRLPELLAAEPSEPVFIPEGEKDCDRLGKLGLVATCNSGGAGNWRSEYNEHLKGRPVVVLPDADGPGRKHAEQVAASVQGVAASVKVVELSGLVEGADVSDWLDSGNTVDQLRELAAAAAKWKTEASKLFPKLGKHAEASNRPKLGHFPLTDTGLAERFAQQHAGRVRYCYPWGKWLAWDGRRWNEDATGIVEQLAKRTARSILQEAAAESDSDRMKDLCRFAASAESAHRRRAMLQLAQSEPGIPVLPDVLNTDPWALNVLNGTIDLRTGELRKHRPEDLITKLAPVEYQPDAKCPVWLRFLTDIFKGNSELVGFVQRLLGYCLTGNVSEQVLPIFYGTGSNGKSTLVNVVLGLLGDDYSIKAPPDMLMLKYGTHPTERADLHGKRFVACIETEEGRRLAESLTKDLTGGDKIRARRMREDYWQFDPTHKIVLACNHKPVIKGTDHAIWRRVRLVPFMVVIPDAEQDTALPEKLRAEMAGILAWCVRGCRDWQRDGLGNPGEVQAATGDYRQEQDTIGGFLAECCTLGDMLTVKASVLLEAYREWSGDKKFAQRRFGLALTERGYERFHNRGTWYRGIDLAGE